MKTLTSIIISFLLVSFSFAKMSSTVEITKIQSVTVEDDKIIIIGTAAYSSRMVTTEQSKDSDFLIGGKPSMKYEAMGYGTTIVLSPYNQITVQPKSLEEQQEAARKQNEYTASLWRQSLDLAKTLKAGSSITISISPEEVILHRGYLKSVTGRGYVKKLP